MLLIIVFGLDIDASADNVFHMLAGGLCVSLVFTAQGWFAGSFSSNDQVAQAINIFMTLLFMLTSGGLGSSTAYPWYINWLQYVSPLRYGFQIFIIALTKQIPDENGLRSGTLSS